jgi:hypothetical protein
MSGHWPPGRLPSDREWPYESSEGSAPDITSYEWIAAANAELEHGPCPMCHRIGTARVARIFVAKPIGSFSLAGQQMKTTGSFVAVLSCTGCEQTARLDGVES